MIPITMLPNTMTAPTVIPVAMSCLAFRTGGGRNWRGLFRLFGGSLGLPLQALPAPAQDQLVDLPQGAALFGRQDDRGGIGFIHAAPPDSG